MRNDCAAAAAPQMAARHWIHTFYLEHSSYSDCKNESNENPSAAGSFARVPARLCERETFAFSDTGAFLRCFFFTDVGVGGGFSSSDEISCTRGVLGGESSTSDSVAGCASCCCCCCCCCCEPVVVVVVGAFAVEAVGAMAMVGAVVEAVELERTVDALSTSELADVDLVGANATFALETSACCAAVVREFTTQRCLG
jgi:hypothetical protein